MTEIHTQASACKSDVADISARRFRLLIDLNYAPELSARIIENPAVYHRLVGARDPNAMPRREISTLRFHSLARRA